jgi:hypothetical protein
MKNILKFLAPLALISSFSSIAENTQNNVFNNEVSTYVHNQKIALSMAPVKSRSDLFALLQTDSPLDMLSVSARDRFVDSVVFTKNGIGGYYYGDLEAELTPSQIYQVLSLIGVQHSVFNFKNARVESEADLLLLSQPIETSFTKLSNNTTEFKKGIIPQPRMRADHKGYYCAGGSTCDERQGSICMSSC